MGKKNSEYYQQLKKLAAKTYPGKFVEIQRKYALNIIETISEFDLFGDFHAKYLQENRYDKNSSTLYYPSLARAEVSQLGVIDQESKKNSIPVHIEYFNPNPLKKSINHDEPLMHLLTIEQYLTYMVNEFTLIADYAIEHDLICEFFEALTNDARCFEVAIRSIRSWYNEQLDLKKEYKDQTEALDEISKDMKKFKLTENLDDSAPLHPLLAYYMSTRRPIILDKTISYQEIEKLTGTYKHT